MLYSSLKVETIRKIREYLVEIKSNLDYIFYEQRADDEETR